MPELSETLTTESPADPNSGATYRLARLTAIGLGVAIALIIGVMIYGLSAGWGHHAAPPPAPAKKTVGMTLAPGFRILSSDTQPGRLILHIRSDTVDEILVINTDDGSIVARIHGDAPK